MYMYLSVSFSTALPSNNDCHRWRPREFPTFLQRQYVHGVSNRWVPWLREVAPWTARTRDHVTQGSHFYHLCPYQRNEKREWVESRPLQSFFTTTPPSSISAGFCPTSYHRSDLIACEKTGLSRRFFTNDKYCRICR